MYIHHWGEEKLKKARKMWKIIRNIAIENLEFQKICI